MESLRTFIAINVKVETELATRWRELKKLLNNDIIKWVNEDSLHLTLFFLGDTPIDKIDPIKQNLERELRNFASFNITIKGFGTFGHPKSPKVIWAGIANTEKLNQLNKIISDAIIPLGFEAQSEKFSPHFTLGRVKQMRLPNGLANFINKNVSNILQEVKVDEVIFYQSILKPSGPVYKSLKTIKLPYL